METKICSKCNEVKKVCEFHKGKTKDGYQYCCKQCKKNYSLLNKEMENIRKNKWKLNNSEKVTNSKKKYYNNNRLTEIKRNTSYSNNRKKNDPIFKLSCNVRTRIFNFIKNTNIKKTNQTFIIIGCSPEFLKEYLEKKFINGMDWNNYGKWHVDHIIPLSSSNTQDEFFNLCHYTNLQPLWAEDNLKKGNKLVYI